MLTTLRARISTSKHRAQIKGLALVALASVLLTVLIAVQKPAASLSQQQLTFSDAEPGSSQTLTLTNPGCGTLEWSAVSDAAWLTISPPGGMVGTGKSCSITLSVDAAAAPVGENTATIHLSSANSTAVDICVDFKVSEESRLIRQTVGQNTLIYSDKEPPYARDNSGAPFKLVDNPAAHQPTWSELLQFLEQDRTQSGSYVPGVHDCSAFAEELHNRAEECGIRAAVVIVKFADGNLHALNAFITQDKGLVFVDDTGIAKGTAAANPDKIAYIKVGREYGLIDTGLACSPDYAFYKDYQNKVGAYEVAVNNFNSLVSEYNQEAQDPPPLVTRSLSRDKAPLKYNPASEVFNITRQPVSELEQDSRRIEEEKEKLAELGRQIGEVGWSPLGVVSQAEIYW